MLEWAFITAVDSSIHQPYRDKASDRADRLETLPTRSIQSPIVAAALK